jgi:glutamate formiminotransferase
MRRRIVECVPNFSEGRDVQKVDAIAAAIARGPGIAILGKTMDADHNRSVITFAGTPEAVAEAALRAVTKAAELIDLNTHVGVHPRIGATDVLPFVPVEGITLEECAALAVSVAEEIWRRLFIPVYLYEAAARRPERKRLEVIRRGQFEELRDAAIADVDRAPDIGGPALHPTCGATVVGARPFLIAYNINLATEDVRVAQRIARSIRASSRGFPEVKALGLQLASRGQTQVSMNLTDYRCTPVHVVFEEVRRQAAEEGAPIAGSEIIGLIPKAALEMAAAYFLRCENFNPDMVVENRLAEELPFTVDDMLDEISDPARGAGGGSAAALAGGIAAALGVLTCRLMKTDAEAFAAHRHFFRAAADRDAHAFASLMRTSTPSEDAVVEATETPLSIAECASVLSADLRRLIEDCPQRYVSDVFTAVGLASSAKAGAISTVELNLPRISDAATRESMDNRLQAIK